ncbi:MAG: T9SS type A sorting domain-containing protein [Bacteroidaceae bacterium]|nr:T9SS type A sorting domain-containing protein [Bacteroidaceae bacterium]
MLKHFLPIILCIVAIAAPVTASANVVEPKQTAVPTQSAGEFLAVVFGAIPADFTCESVMCIESPDSRVNVDFEGRTITVFGCEGKKLTVYDVAGNIVLTLDIDSDYKQIVIDAPRGLYIVRVANIARKIQIR